MFHSRECNNRINRIHERAPRIPYKHYTSSFQDLLNNDKSGTIHNKNLQILATEIYKFLNGLSPKIMGKTFQLNEHNYALRVLMDHLQILISIQCTMVNSLYHIWLPEYGNKFQITPRKVPLLNLSN